MLLRVFRFTSANNSILFCCLRRNVEPCCHTHDSRPPWLCIARDPVWSISHGTQQRIDRTWSSNSSCKQKAGRRVFFPLYFVLPYWWIKLCVCEIQTTVQQLLIARPNNHWFRYFSLTHLHSTGIPIGILPSRLVWLPDDGVATRWWKKLKITLFVLTQCTSVTDAHTQTPHDGIGRAYA